ncbi:MAG: DsbA family protein [Pseudomonadota bacterium]|nr:DsbA family protein [Pseudomonadota bacterium]
MCGASKTSTGTCTASCSQASRRWRRRSWLADAQAIGLKVEPFKKCLDSGKYAERVRSGIAVGQSLGITGTPTLLLGISDGTRVNLVRMMVGAQPFALY